MTPALDHSLRRRWCNLEVQVLSRILRNRTKMAPRRKCPVCGSRQWHKEPSSGLVTCSEGHVLQVCRRDRSAALLSPGNFEAHAEYDDRITGMRRPKSPSLVRTTCASGRSGRKGRKKRGTPTPIRNVRRLRICVLRE